MKLRKSRDVADLDVLHHRDHAIADVGPERLRDVDAARRRALLPLVLEAAARDRHRDLLRIGRRVHDDEVLAAGFADQPRIAAVRADVLADLLPHAVEHRRAAGEVDAGELGRVEQRRWRSAGGSPGTKLMTPGGRPAASSSLHRVVARSASRSPPASRSRCCPSAPGAVVRLPPIAVKLNGEIA